MKQRRRLAGLRTLVLAVVFGMVLPLALHAGSWFEIVMSPERSLFFTLDRAIRVDLRRDKISVVVPAGSEFRTDIQDAPAPEAEPNNGVHASVLKALRAAPDCWLEVKPGVWVNVNLANNIDIVTGKSARASIRLSHTGPVLVEVTDAEAVRKLKAMVQNGQR